MYFEYNFNVELNVLVCHLEASRPHSQARNYRAGYDIFHRLKLQTNFCGKLEIDSVSLDQELKSTNRTSLW